MEERLQKILATAGVASRRAAEDLIRAGRVRVNGQVVTRLGTAADPDRDLIAVDDRPLGRAAERVYLALHKPVGVVTTVRDPQGRPTVLDLLRQSDPAQARSFSQQSRLGSPQGAPDSPAIGRVYPVGRLDLDSSGLVLLTDDGELAARLTHPRYHVEKEYLVEVQGDPPDEALAHFEAGLVLDGRETAPARVWREGRGEAAAARGPGTGEAQRRPENGAVSRGKDQARGTRTTWLGIVLREGRKRQIRRMWQILGYPVITLIRLRIGPVRLGRLRAGRWRVLGWDEVRRLREAVGLPARPGDHAYRH